MGNGRRDTGASAVIDYREISDAAFRVPIYRIRESIRVIIRLKRNAAVIFGSETDQMK